MKAEEAALSQATPSGDELSCSADGLLVFVDDTGDPTYHDPGNPIFVLGGCALLARDINTVIRKPWAAVRSAVAGDPTTPLHAKDVERRLIPRKEAAIRKFFIEQPVRRIATISSVTTDYRNVADLPDPVVRYTIASLLQRIVEVARWMPFTSITVIFEDTSCLRPRFEEATAGFNFQVDGKPIPHEWCTMPKSAGEPGLEVADFLMHTVAGYGRSGRDPQGKFAARFSAIIGTIDERWRSFVETESVAYSFAC
jgi:hypothetical protein